MARRNVLRFPFKVPKYKIKKGYTGKYYAVFEDNYDVEEMEWLLGDYRICSFGQFDNAYELGNK